LANIKHSKDDLVLRNHENMQTYFKGNEEKEVCIELVENIF
jgi:hypothetical protein